MNTKHQFLRLKTFLFGIVLSFFLLLFIETFLRANKYFAWFDRSLREAKITRTLPTDQVLTEEMTALLKPSMERFPGYMYPRDKAARKEEGVDTSTKFADHFYDMTRGERKYLEYISECRGDKSKTLIYSVHISFDEYATRTVVQRPTTGDKKYVFTGCSFTFGEGANDGETMPDYFQSLRPKSQVYNFALGGESPSNILHELEKNFDERYSNVDLTDADFLYVFIDDHIYRSICPMSCLAPERNWILSLENYEMTSKDDVEHKGKFAAREPLNSWYKSLMSLELVRFSGVDFPAMPGPTSIHRFVTIVKKMKHYALDRLKAKNFYFVFHPQTGPNTALLESELQKADINVADLRNTNYHRILGDNFAIPLDMHPTPLMNELTARLLDRKIPKDF